MGRWQETQSKVLYKCKFVEWAFCVYAEFEIKAVKDINGFFVALGGHHVQMCSEYSARALLCVFQEFVSLFSYRKCFNSSGTLVCLCQHSIHSGCSQFYRLVGSVKQVDSEIVNLLSVSAAEWMCYGCVCHHLKGCDVCSL